MSASSKHNLDGVPYFNGAFGVGTGDIVLDNVRCSSSNSQLIDCPSNRHLASNCDHRNDAGVGCEGM